MRSGCNLVSRIRVISNVGIINILEALLMLQFPIIPEIIKFILQFDSQFFLLIMGFYLVIQPFH
jgi:hypothetical protein